MAPFPGWHDLIDAVHAANIRTACLSNTNATHWRLMTTPGSAHHLPLDRLHFRIASHLVGAYKPEPAIYEALERESSVAPNRIVFLMTSKPTASVPRPAVGMPISSRIRAILSHKSQRTSKITAYSRDDLWKQDAR